MIDDNILFNPVIKYQPVIKSDIVTLNVNHDKILSKDMSKWIEDNKEKEFYIEKIDGIHVKLKGVFFWITSDLLIIKENKTWK